MCGSCATGAGSGDRGCDPQRATGLDCDREEQYDDSDVEGKYI